MTMVWVIDVRVNPSLLDVLVLTLREGRGTYLEYIPKVFGLAGTTANSLVQEHVKEPIKDSSSLSSHTQRSYQAYVGMWPM